MKTKHYIIVSLSLALIIAAVAALKRKLKKMNTYFSIDELTRSDTAIRRRLDNTPSPEVQESLQRLIDNVLDPARRAFGSAISVNSGYRSPAVNAAVGGSATSQHVKGEAADITGGSVTKNREIFAIIASQNIPFDQMIWEQGGKWVHVSHSSNGPQRGQLLKTSGNGYINITSNWKTAIA